MQPPTPTFAEHGAFFQHTSDYFGRIIDYFEHSMNIIQL